jgi:hypothetical protein
VAHLQDAAITYTKSVPTYPPTRKRAPTPSQPLKYA